MIRSEPQKTIYKRNFITNVVFRIDYPKILNLSEKKPPSKFQDTIIKRFPQIKVNRQSEIKTEISKNSKLSISAESIVSWSFLNLEKTIKITIGSDNLIIGCYRYKNFTEFFKTITYVLDNFMKLYNTRIVNRLGLRYINQIKIGTGNPLDWDNLIAPSLFSVSKDFVKKSDRNSISRSMHLLEINEEKYKLIFQYGMHNSEYPDPINRKEFILDYDCISKEEIKITEILNKAKTFNAIISKWFELSIMDGLRKEMGGASHEN